MGIVRAGRRRYGTDGYAETQSSFFFSFFPVTNKQAWSSGDHVQVDAADFFFFGSWTTKQEVK